ncbi:hypothetical protein [Lentzea sp. NPDC051838]|uniref:hypothetical protein n=1 Tax=Lentzea sp. NPDC051838 TaxID=3154849 RepID=UPI003440EC8D
MATTYDIARRVEEADSARSARRTKGAQLVGELAQERTAVVQRLADIDQQIGDAIVDYSDVISVDELAAFTETAPADLTQILNARKPNRGRRKRRTTSSPRSTAEQTDSVAVPETGTP